MLPEGTSSGWYFDPETPAGNYELKAGAQFWLNIAEAASITISGQVNNNDVVITLGEGFTPIGNCSPVSRKLHELSTSGLNEFDSIQIFDANGDVETEIAYFVEGSILPEGTPSGWYFDPETSASDFEIKAGQGFWLSCAEAGGTITIPSAL